MEKRMNLVTKTQLMAAASLMLAGASVAGAATISMNRDAGGASGAMETTGTFIFSDSPVIPSNSNADLANGKSFTSLFGTPNGNGNLANLTNGVAQTGQDQPASSFYYNDNSDGRLRLDLGAAYVISSINTYSWHTGTRAPQNYDVFGALAPTNSSPNAAAAAFRNETAMSGVGFTKIASVNTNSLGGAQHGVSIADINTAYRYIILDVDQPTGGGVGTFFGEIDIYGTLAAPEIAVSGNAVDIVDGDATPDSSDFTNFGVTTEGNPITKTFRVSNTGNVSMTTSGLTLPTGYSIFEGLSTSIGAGLFDDFTVQLDAAVAGIYAGDISFTNSDSSEASFNFAITGEVQVPEPGSLALLGLGGLLIGRRRAR